ncbi:MAG: glycosyltransferase [Bacillota bacterium]
MKILVYNTAASEGGALTILKMYYDNAKKDKNNNYKFIVSTNCIEKADNIEVEIYSKPKKNWIQRILFDRFDAPKIINYYNPDVVYNLQNIIINGINAQQIIYMHQSLPFSNVKISICESKKLWVYQNIIGKRIKSSCRKADKIIVQTQWIRDAIIEKCKINEDKILLEAPNIDVSNIKTYAHITGQEIEFFYPANGSFFKNHNIIIDALILLSNEGYNPKMTFTLYGNENKSIALLKKQCVNYNLNVQFIGTISKNHVYDYYSRTVLLFPSYIESFGLPLLEAKNSGTPIVAANTDFAREILVNYSNVQFFDYKNVKALSDIILQIYNDSIEQE